MTDRQMLEDAALAEGHAYPWFEARFALLRPRLPKHHGIVCMALSLARHVFKSCCTLIE